MGQRTVVAVKKIDRTGKEDLKLIHFQWGFGKTMPCKLMQEFLACEYNNDKTKYNGTLKNFFNFTDSKNNLYTTRGFKRNGKVKDIFSREFLQKLYNRIDNNNGAMLIEVEEEPNATNCKGEIYDRGYVRLKNIKISFVLGSEECNYNRELGKYIGEKPFTRFVSSREYMEKTGGKHYCPNEFVEMFETFCKFWGIEEIVD